MMSGFTFYANKPSERYHKSDILFLISVIFLWGLGIFTLFVCSQNSAERIFGDSYRYVKRQLITSFIGCIFFMIFFLSDMKFIRKMIAFIVIISFILCVFTFIPAFSIEKNGARRWLKMPLGFSFQPSELVKFSLILFLANYFDKQEQIDNPDDKTVAPCVGAFLFFIVIVALQKDFSTSIFITLIGILMFFVSGTKLKWVFPFLIVAIPVAVLMVLLQQYRIDRIIGYLQPTEGGTTYNFQTLAAKRAVSAGGMWGSGIGNDLVRIDSIPEIQADYIFAGWAEAMGFVGVFAYFVSLCFFAWRGYRAAFLCPDRFASYSAFGCVSVIFMQSIINCMVVCGLLPSTGIPLPFFSLGGSSIIITFAMCGFVLNASRCEESTEINIQNDDFNDDAFTLLNI